MQDITILHLNINTVGVLNKNNLCSSCITIVWLYQTCWIQNEIEVSILNPN